jgi:type I restriction enzyme S subunit
MSELYELPNGWEWQKLINVSSIDNQTVAPKDSEEYNYISLEHIESNTGKIVNFTKSVGSEIQSSKVAFPKGAVLYGKLRPYLNKVAIAPFDGIATTEILPIKPNVSKLNPNYLAFYLRSDGFVSEAMSNISGARMPRITMTFVRDELHIPIAPLTEQQRIVEKLDQLFEKIDKAIALHQKNIDEADAFMGSALNEVFGELEEKYEGVELTKYVTFNGGSQPPKSQFSEVQLDGYVRLIQIRDYKSDNHIVYVNKKSVRKFCTKDDVMIGRYGPPVFQILRGIDGAYNVALMRAEPNEKHLTKDYLFNFLQNPKLQNYIIGLSQRAAGQSGVNKEALEQYLIPIPPLPTQQKVVTYLDDLSEKIERVKTVQKEKMDSLKALKASILDKAFRGEL